MHKMYIGGVFLKKTIKKASRIISLVLVIVCVLSTMFFIIFDKCLGYQIEFYAKQVTINRISSEVNKAVISEMEKSGISYEKIIHIEKSDEGEISGIRADMVQVNILKNKLEICVSQVCSKNEYYEVEIPVGNFFGRGIFYGKGFKIKIKFRPLASASTKMTGEFVEAGINQTIYRISFDVNTDAVVVFPFRYVEVPINCETVIAETIIVGDVPDSFTHFDLQGDITSQDFQGYVEDYMAE